MKTDTEKLEQDGFSGSLSAPNPESNSGKSARKSRNNSKPAPAKDAGKEVETKLSGLDYLLTLLQSDLGEIRDMGSGVQFFTYSGGLMIQLSNVAICQTHKMMHSGQICPMC